MELKILSNVVSDYTDTSTHEARSVHIMDEVCKDYINSLEKCKAHVRKLLWHLPDHMRERKVVETLLRMKEDDAKHHGPDFLKAMLSYRNACKFINNYRNQLPEGVIIAL